MDIKHILNVLPLLQQRQDSTFEQLKDLKAIANKLGMYDAADVLETLLTRK